MSGIIPSIGGRSVARRLRRLGLKAAVAVAEPPSHLRSPWRSYDGSAIPRLCLPVGEATPSPEGLGWATPSQRDPATFSRLGARLCRLARVALVLAALAFALAAAGAAEIRSQRMIAPGVSYTMVRRSQGPFNVNIIELDPRERYISLAGAGAGGGRLPVSALADRASSVERYAVAAVNGDYFVMGGPSDGVLLGLNVSGGELLTAGGGRSALVLLDDGTAQVVMLRVEAWLETSAGKRIPISALNQPRGRQGVVLYTPTYGTSTKTQPSGREVVLAGVPEPLELGRAYEAQVTASTHAVGNLALWPEHVAVSAPTLSAAALEGVAVGDAVKLCVDLAPHLQGKIVDAVGGGPRLVRDGRISVESGREDFKADHSQRRHPRTAAGVKPDGRVVLVTVDGRQACSVGMTLDELARLMLDLGCRDAVNLDGGGSTTMWVRGEVVNSPCNGSQRPVGNALLVMSAAPHGPATRVRLEPESIAALPGYRTTVEVEAQDDYYNPISFDAGGVGWACEGGIGEISPRGEFTAGDVTETVTGAVKVYLRGAKALVPVTVYARPPQLRISPDRVAAAPGQQVQLSVSALDDDGNPIAFDPAQVSWKADPAAGAMDQAGMLVAGTGPVGTVTASLRGVEAAARVVFATTTVVADDLEKEGARTAFSWPREVPVSCERVTEPVREGKYAARLTYDFTTTTDSRAAFLPVDRDIGNAVALRAWVYGDGRGHWLRAKITDAGGQSFNLDFAPQVDWTGWREVTASVPPAAQAPIRWAAIYISEFHPDRQDAGALVFDLLRAEVAGPP